MIWLDVTKSAAARHSSGLTRVTLRLAEEFGAAATAVTHVDAAARGCRAADWYLTAEVFAPAERPGFAEFIARRPCRLGAIYHDSIPLRLPHITWPQAVARHPAYLAMLCQFDRIWAVSAASRDELLGYWKWQGKKQVPEVVVLALGADLGRETQSRSPMPPAPSPAACQQSPSLQAVRARSALSAPSPTEKSRNAVSAPLPSFLCVGILEPRKNQSFLLEVADRLWGEGLRFDLRFVGRVNPHFGKPVLAEIRAMQRKRAGLHYDGAVDDRELSRRYGEAAACLFPTIAEGCGLPLLEALWHGTPCIASDVPSLMENAAGGGCLVLPCGNTESWTSALRKFIAEPAYGQALAEGAQKRRPTLPTWTQTARAISGLA